MSEPTNPPPSRAAQRRKLLILLGAIVFVVTGTLIIKNQFRAPKPKPHHKGHAGQHGGQKKKKPVAHKKKSKQSEPEKSGPLSPEEELAGFTLEPGFRAELVAAEPLVHNPVALAFDPEGRVWVCEMQGYMPNAAGDGEKEPTGQVVILEDTDGDGRLDKRTVFLDGLVLPRAIALVKGGALIAEPPNLWYCPDRDGDGKADEKIPVDPAYTPPSSPNPEHLPNGLLLAMDNTIYNAKSAVAYQPRADGGFEKIATEFRGQWGLAQDDWGRLYYNYHLSPLHADVFSSARYLGRPQSLQHTAGINAGLTEEKRVWPSHLTLGVNSGKRDLKDGRLARFTSACGPTIYRGDLFPAEYRGNAFICEPAGNLIKRMPVHEKDGAPIAANAYEDKDFLASNDERFRPVNLYTGPDGALWIADMFHGIIEHSTYMTPALKRHIAERGLDQPGGQGRIWRIVPEGAAPGPWPKLAHDTTAELVAQLEHPNGWQRDTAQRLLVEQQNAEAVPALVALATRAKLGPSRLQALWTLQGLGKLDATLVEQALGDVEPKVRAGALRLSESFIVLSPKLQQEALGQIFDTKPYPPRPEAAPPTASPDLRQRILGMISDPDPSVQIQLMLTLGEWNDAESTKAMATLLCHEKILPYVEWAALTGLAGRELAFLKEFLASPATEGLTLAKSRLVQYLIAAILEAGQPERCVALLDFIAQQPASRIADLVKSLAHNPEISPERHRLVPLAQEPAAWPALAAAADPALLAEAGDLFSWPGKPSKLEHRVVPFNEDQQRLFNDGKALFTQICGVCHQPTGRGLEGLAPPLLDSEYALGSEERLVRVVLNGLNGPITVHGRNYFMEMPPFGSLSDEQIASVLTYIRREWGHTADPVEPRQVSEIRAAVGPRDRPWTALSLDRWN